MNALFPLKQGETHVLRHKPSALQEAFPDEPLFRALLTLYLHPPPPGGPSPAELPRYEHLLKLAERKNAKEFWPLFFQHLQARSPERVAALLFSDPAFYAAKTLRQLPPQKAKKLAERVRQGMPELKNAFEFSKTLEDYGEQEAKTTVVATTPFAPNDLAPEKAIHEALVGLERKVPTNPRAIQRFKVATALIGMMGLGSLTGLYLGLAYPDSDSDSGSAVIPVAPAASGDFQGRPVFLPKPDLNAPLPSRIAVPSAVEPQPVATSPSQAPEFDLQFKALERMRAELRRLLNEGLEHAKTLGTQAERGLRETANTLSRELTALGQELKAKAEKAAALHREKTLAQQHPKEDDKKVSERRIMLARACRCDNEPQETIHTETRLVYQPAFGRALPQQVQVTRRFTYCVLRDGNGKLLAWSSFSSCPTLCGQDPQGETSFFFDGKVQRYDGQGKVSHVESLSRHRRFPYLAAVQEACDSIRLGSN